MMLFLAKLRVLERYPANTMLQHQLCIKNEQAKSFKLNDI